MSKTPINWSYSSGYDRYKEKETGEKVRPTTKNRTPCLTCKSQTIIFKLQNQYISIDIWGKFTENK